MDRGVPTQTDGLRVALVSEYYYPDIGGMPEHVHQLGRALVGRGHRVTVITTSFPGHVDVPSDTPFDVVRVGRASPPLITNGSLSLAAIGLGLRRKLLRLFAERRFDVIHVHAPIFPTLALLAISCAPPEALLVGTLHTHFERSSVIELFRRPLQRYLDALDGLIAVSDTALESMQRIGFRCDAEIIPNGVDLDGWRSGRRIPSLRGQADLVLLSQARLEPRNRIETVIAAQRPLFGICRGFQLLNVMQGGTLYQDIATQRPDSPAHRDLCVAWSPGWAVDLCRGKDPVPWCPVRFVGAGNAAILRDSVRRRLRRRGQCFPRRTMFLVKFVSFPDCS